MQNGPRNAVRWLLAGSVMMALVVLPFLLLEESALRLTGLVMNTQHRWALAGWIVALLAADVFLPVPSSVVATGAGLLLGYAAGFTAIWVGLTTGCVLGYWFGTTAGRAFVLRAVSEEGLASAERLFMQFGTFALVICRAVPVLAEVSVIFAGISRMRLRTFAAVVVTSNAGIAAAYAAIGYFALTLDSWLLALIAAMALPAVAGVLVKGLVRRSAGGLPGTATGPQ
jgi:3-dehydroquinate synthase